MSKMLRLVWFLAGAAVGVMLTNAAYTHQPPSGRITLPAPTDVIVSVTPIGMAFPIPGTYAPLMVAESCGSVSHEYNPVTECMEMTITCITDQGLTYHSYNC